MGSVRAKWRLALVMLPALVYANAFDNPFHYDDFHSIVDNPHIRSLAHVPHFFGADGGGYFSVDPQLRMYRPLLLTTYALNYAVGGYQPWGWHLVGLGLHIGCVLLVFALGRRLLGDVQLAGLAAAVFAVHPVNSETLNYISSRSELLAGLSLLAVLWFYCGGQEEKPRWAGVLLAFAGGLLGKSVAIVAPGVLLAYEILIGRRLWQTLWRGYAALGVITAAYIVWVGSSLHRAVAGRPVRPYDEQFWTQAKALVLYLKLLVWPSGLSVDHQFLLSSSPWELYAGTATLFLASLTAWLLWRRRRHGVLLFAWVFGLLALAPASVVPLNVLFNEHRLYLPSAAFAWAVAYGGGLLWRRLAAYRGALMVVAALGLCGLAATTVARNRVWATAERLWGDAVSKAPLMARPRLYLAEALAQKGQLEAAQRHLRQALPYDSGPAYLRLADLLERDSRWAEAAEVLADGLARHGGTAAQWAYLAGLCRQAAFAADDASRTWMERSVDAYERALSIDPVDDDLYDNLGNTYQVLGRPDEAARQHLEALHLDPGDARSWVNLGNARRMQKQATAALEAYRRAVELDPDYAGAWISLAATLEEGRQLDQALEAYRRAAALDGQYAAQASAKAQALEAGRVE